MLIERFVSLTTLSDGRDLDMSTRLNVVGTFGPSEVEEVQRWRGILIMNVRHGTWGDLLP
jgi:hypothetical protein